jgi:hypothetical protein
MKDLNRTHRELLVDDLRQAKDKKVKMEGFHTKLLNDLESESSEKHKEQIQAFIDIHKFRFQFIDNEIEMIENALVEGIIL